MGVGRGSGARRSSLCLILVLLFASSFIVVGTTQVAAEGKASPGIVKVDGGLLASITTSPLQLVPAFAPTITDYVLRCQAGVNAIQLTLNARAGGTISVGEARGHSVEAQASLVENQALVISAAVGGVRAVDDVNSESRAGGRIDYWIRCLPHDFPQLTVSRPGNPRAGWYLTGNIKSAARSGTYAMVLDNQGTPVWYHKTPNGAINVTPLPGNVIAWISFGDAAFSLYHLELQTTSQLAAPVPPTDTHDFDRMANGDTMLLSIPLRTGFDLSSLGLSSSAAIQDCVVQEVNSSGNLVWEWRASDHVLAGESIQPLAFDLGGGLVAYDIFHCNSIDTDPVSGNVLVSFRHTDAVYLIDKITGGIIWKLGGTPTSQGHAQILTIAGDPQGAFHAQHDARFQPHGDISLYDDQTWNPSVAARGVEYHIHTATATATLVWSYTSPDGRNSNATGSFRRLSGGTDNVICWGFRGDSLFTEVDQTGAVMLDVRFPNGEGAYRVIKVATSALDHEMLRATSA